ncbi:acyltransferase [Butyrivibrio sp. AC2005]|uniref:acyltransferase n=1 Tax=Butyrivibrio sp. AC2005 TaxID=1280672 RepID=UPI00040D648A|nr:acyltransferase [Butyrivibrio sp. AC2005]
MVIKRLLKRLLKKNYVTSDEYIRQLRNKGIIIGEKCIFYHPGKTNIDTQNPGMIRIGNNVRITEGVQILTHDYSFSVLCSVKGDIVGSVEPVSIGNNVFIGRNAFILKGVTIGDNVIIGAGSIVSKNCESNSVYAGNPAKRICSTEEMYNKRKEKQLENAKRVALTYYKETGIKPDETVLREYQLLFTPRDIMPETIKALIDDSGCIDLCMDYYKNSKPMFDGLDKFLLYCGIK